MFKFKKMFIEQRGNEGDLFLNAFSFSFVFFSFAFNFSSFSTS